jgi:hypothetical protein
MNSVAKRARELFIYEPDTGALRWRVDRVSKLRSGNNITRVRAGDIAGTTQSQGYRSVYMDNRQHLAHRVIWLIVHGEWPPHQIDHINGDRLDNRLCNLRAVRQHENMLNRGAQSNSKTGVKGVSWDKREQRFVVRLKVAGKYRSFGQYRTLEEAVSACARVTAEYHGGFSRA